MSIIRTSLLAGPAAVIFNGHTLFAHDGILITPALEADKASDRVESDAEGALDTTVSQALVKIAFTPSAPFADLLALYPHLQAAPGSSLFGDADTPLVLIGANGVRLTFSAVAIIGMPDLTLTTRGPIAGAVTFLALGARTLGLSTTNRLVTIDTAAVPLPPRGTPQLADDFVINWGATPWLNLRSRDGVKIHFELHTQPVFSDANALVDLTLDRLEVTAKFTPASPEGPDEGDLVAALQLQGANALPGRSLAATAALLEIAGEHLHVQLPLAQLTRAELAFDAVRPRVGELTFEAERVFLQTARPLAELGAGAF